ncbi:MAG: glycosyltransferase, partial [Reyranellaceae bacterium]
MRVLLVSYAFAPSIGGVETASLILATELRRRGHEVAVVTATQAEAPPAFDYEVHYQPSNRQLLGLHRWADLVLHNGYSLRFAWPLLFVRRPWVVIHASDFRPGLLRRLVAGAAAHISVSEQVARTVPMASTVVGNAYRADLFAVRNEGSRRYRFGFVGRLVSDKGAAHLLEALSRLTGAGE